MHLDVPNDLLGRTVDFGETTVTREMITAYARAAGDEDFLAGPMTEAPPTFCLTMRRGLTPEIPLPPGTFGVYGGHDIEFHQPIRAGHTYRVRACVLDVYEKSGRSGALTVVVREATIRDIADALVVRIIERQVIRPLPQGS